MPFDGKETAVVNAMLTTLKLYTRNVTMLSYTVGAPLASTLSPAVVTGGRRLASTRCELIVNQHAVAESQSLSPVSMAQMITPDESE